MAVFTAGDESGKVGTPDFKGQVLLQGVGDCTVQSQGRETGPRFRATMNAISFGSSHTGSFGDRLETTPGQFIRSLRTLVPEG